MQLDFKVSRIDLAIERYALTSSQDFYKLAYKVDSHELADKHDEDYPYLFQVAFWNQLSIPNYVHCRADVVVERQQIIEPVFLVELVLQHKGVLVSYILLIVVVLADVEEETSVEVGEHEED